MVKDHTYSHNSKVFRTIFYCQDILPLKWSRGVHRQKGQIYQEPFTRQRRKLTTGDIVQDWPQDDQPSFLLTLADEITNEKVKRCRINP